MVRLDRGPARGSEWRVASEIIQQAGRRGDVRLSERRCSVQVGEQQRRAGSDKGHTVGRNDGGDCGRRGGGERAAGAWYRRQAGSGGLPLAGIGFPIGHGFLGREKHPAATRHTDMAAFEKRKRRKEGARDPPAHRRCCTTSTSRPSCPVASVPAFFEIDACPGLQHSVIHPPSPFTAATTLSAWCSPSSADSPDAGLSEEQAPFCFCWQTVSPCRSTRPHCPLATARPHQAKRSPYHVYNGLATHSPQRTIGVGSRARVPLAVPTRSNALATTQNASTARPPAASAST